MTTGALERCVGDPERFAGEHWGRRPLLHRGDGLPRLDRLLGVPDVDHLVTGSLLRIPAFRMVKDGAPIPASRYTHTIRIGNTPVERTARPDRVLDLFAEGATIVLQALHRQWPPVARFCRDLEMALTHPVQANAYVTPPTSRGFAVHHDTHDVFVLQTHGRKAWRVFEPLVELAGPEQPWSKDLGETGAPILEAELRPGDVLYLPRGFPHDAQAREEVSIHVTVGIVARTWLDVWRHLLRRAADHRPFREPLPLGFARATDSFAPELATRVKDLAAWLEDSAGPDDLASFARRFWSTLRPELGGQFEQLERLSSAGPETRFRRRPSSIFEVSVTGGQATALLGTRELRMPAFCEPALRRIAEGEEVSAAGLPGLDGAGSLVLLRRLVREGALEILDGGG